MSSKKLFTVVALSIIMIGALFVRLYGLSEYAFTDDEAWHLVVADQKSLWDVIQFNFQEEIHPPLSYIIWHYMLQISHNDLWLRMSSIIPGILLVPSAYLFGRLYIGKAAGFYLAFLFAFGAMPMSISATIRAYSPMMLCLTWAAIFVHKYCSQSQITRNVASVRNVMPSLPKHDSSPEPESCFDRASMTLRTLMTSGVSLILYSICALGAIEFNHAACFALLALGLILLFRAFKDKNKKDFILISAIHVTLALLVIVYAYILKAHYGFSTTLAKPSDGKLFADLINYVVFFLWFPIGSQAEDVVSKLLSVIALISLAAVPIALIWNKKWLLLQLVFVPLIAVIITDQLRIYPFTGTHRNNLFLLFSISITYAYFFQICVNFFGNFYKNQLQLYKKKTMFFLQISIVLIAVTLTATYVVRHNSFRNTFPNCAEYSIKKSDVELVNEKLQQKNIPGNVFVTVVRNIWYWRLQSGDQGRITILTDHLAKFENGEFAIYFTAFPAREISVVHSLREYGLFFKDLFAHLSLSGDLAKVKSFTAFDIGLGFDYFIRSISPQFIAQKPAGLTERQDQEWQDGYDFGWALQSSKQVLDKIYFVDRSFSCGRELMILSFTPQFVRDEILGKGFVD